MGKCSSLFCSSALRPAADATDGSTGRATQPEITKYTRYSVAHNFEFDDNSNSKRLQRINSSLVDGNKVQQPIVVFSNLLRKGTSHMP